jgi:hypothetical protein
MRILIQYRTNEEYHSADVFYANYVVDLDKLKAFVESADDYSYSADEAKHIIKLAEAKSIYNSYEWHDKYTFYDTSCELQQVLSDDQQSTPDYTVQAYLNM